jgi:hypothetical protein
MTHIPALLHAARLLALIGLLSSASGAVLAQQPVAGKWMLNIDSPQGATTAGLTLAVDGEVVKGSLSGDMGETPIKGTAKGAEVTFSFEFAGPSGPISIGAKATVSGDEIKGEMDYGMGVAPFTGKRATP